MRALLAPRAFFAGWLMAVLGCSLLGHTLAGRPHFRHFVRFHQLISSESFYYPTALQVHTLVKEYARRDRPTVLIGGSSVLNGVGQRAEKLWSVLLQRELKDRAVVLNLAVRAGYWHELGMQATEALIKQEFPVVYVADNVLCASNTNLSRSFYRYFYWDAKFRGFLLDAPEREALLASPNAGETRELRMAAWLNSALGLSFADLWSTVGYTRVFSVWNFLTAPKFWRARKRFRDIEGQAPSEGYYGRYNNNTEMNTVRAYATACDPTNLAASAEKIRTIMPPDVRRRTLMLIIRDSPYYVNQLSVSEQQSHEQNVPATRDALARIGIAAADPTRGFTPRDYVDRIHMSEAGAQKFAVAVAHALDTLLPDTVSRP